MLGSRSCGDIGWPPAGAAGRAAAAPDPAPPAAAAVSAAGAAPLASAPSASGTATDGRKLVGSQRRYSPQLQKSAGSGFSARSYHRSSRRAPRPTGRAGAGYMVGREAGT